MHFTFRARIAFVLSMLLGICFLPTIKAATWYVDAAATGTPDGTSPTTAWTTFASINQSLLTSPGGDVVLVQSGVYNEQFVISQSGASTNSRIIYKGVGSAAGMPVLRGINGGSFNNIAVIGFEFTQLSSANNYAAIRMTGCSGWLIQDNYIHDTYGAGIDGRVNTNNTNDIIRCNKLVNISGIGAGVNNSIAITMTGDSNLIEYNSISESLDRVQAFGSGTVVRNNYWGATDTTLYPNSTPYPYHNDGFQTFDTANPLTKFLYEKNWDTDNKDSVGGTNAHGCTIQNYSAPGYLNWMIFRFNVLVRPGGPVFIFLNIDQVYGYNLTSVAVESGALSPFQNAVAYNPGSTCDTQDWRNNTFTFSPNTMDPAGIFSSSNRATNFTSDYQHRFDAGVLPTAAHNLPNLDPLFTDASVDDYTLQSGSPLMGAGGPLTTAVGSGIASTSLNVADPQRLFDGWGIADADSIKIGSGPYVQISSINYGTGVVTLSSPSAWNDGDSVIVKGMEDVGALPHSYATAVTVSNTTPVTLLAGPATLSATIANPDAVRKVEFLADGIPVGVAYASPYQVTWLADGNVHAIEARAYNAWASKTLFVSSFNTGPLFGTQPVSQTPALGSTVVFTASAVAPGGTSYAPSYQWQYNGVNLTDGAGISGSNTATLTLTGVAASNDGNYAVIASNPTYGSNISDIATINVESPPSFAVQPLPQTVTFGAVPNVSLTATATGLPTPTYQWFENGVPLSDGGRISGSSTATLQITNPMVGDTGTYTVVATNGIGSPATSNPALLTVNPAPQTISFSPLASAITTTAPFTLSATSSSGLPVGYNSSNTGVATVSGITVTVLSLGSTNITASQTGDANYLAATNVIQVLTVNSPLAPVISSSATASATQGAAFSYSIVATNTPTSYNTLGLPAGLAVNSNSGTINGTPTASGTYPVTLQATNANGTGTEQLTLTVGAELAPVISSASSTSATQGVAFTYTITASNLPTSFSATGLPVGLSVDPSTGIISGTPTTAGIFNVSIGATNITGTGAATLSLSVNQAIFSGDYFGTFSSGGNWAIHVGSDNTGEFIADIGGSATAQNIAVSASGSFTVPNAGVTVQSIAGARLTTNATFPILINIGNGHVSGSAGADSLAGAIDSGTTDAALAGFYSAAAVLGGSGNVYAVVGGDGALYAVEVTGTSGDSISGTLGGAGALSGSSASGGTFSLSVNSQGQLSANLTPVGLATINFSGLSSRIAPTARLINLSARATSGTGGDGLIVGFVVTGGPKTILARGIGPTLGLFGVSGALNDPVLSLFNGATQIQANSSWGGGATLTAAFSQVGAFALPDGSDDDAIVSTLQAGEYTAHVVGAGGSTGVALAEIYDADANGLGSASRLINVSARTSVGTGANIAIAGFVVGGVGNETVLIRGVGPTLATFGVTGVLANPQLTLLNSKGTTIVSNSGWGGTAALTNAFSLVGAFPLPATSRDSALLITLAPGSYTAEVSGANGTTGVALVEVYEVP